MVFSAFCTSASGRCNCIIFIILPRDLDLALRERLRAVQFALVDLRRRLVGLADGHLGVVGVTETHRGGAVADAERVTDLAGGRVGDHHLDDRALALQCLAYRFVGGHGRVVGVDPFR